MIDAHIHLDQYDPASLEKEIEEWKKGGVQKVIAVGSDLASSYKVLELAECYPQFVHAAIGHHPEKPLPSDIELQELLRLMDDQHHSIHAIGEIGLPYYEKERLLQKYKSGAYEEMLEIFLLKAKQHHLPAVLHAVHGEAEKALNLVKKHSLEKVHFHWLKATEKGIRDIAEYGCFISVTPEVCYRQRDQLLARMVPFDQLMIETDGPWPYNGPFQGKKTTPLFLEDISSCLSNIFSIQLEAVKKQTASNACTFFGL